MTRDEVYSFGVMLDNALNTCNWIVETTSDTERGPDKLEMLTLRQHFTDLEAFRAEMNAKYGANTL